MRPPTLFSGQRSLDEGIPSIDLIPPSPVLPHKSHVNILNASQLESSTVSNNFVPTSPSCSLLPTALNGSGPGVHSVIIDDISKNPTTATAGPIYVPTISSTAAKLQLPTFGHGRSETNVSSNSATSLSSAMAEAPEPLQRLPSLKRFCRTSSKRKKHDPTPEDLEHQLNNGNDNSCLLTDCSSSRADVFLKPSTTNVPIKNKETNRLSPQNSIRRLSASFSIGSGPGSRRASACLFNSQMYQNLNQSSKLNMGPSKRRMSSIELAFTKTSHLNLHNLEPSRKSLSYTNSKLDLDKWQKAYTNETDMLQQYIQERDKRKSSICQYPKKRNEELPKDEHTKEQQHTFVTTSERYSKLKIIIDRITPHNFTEERKSYSMYIFPEDNR